MFQVAHQEISLPHSKHKLPVLFVDIKESKSVTTMFLANTGSRYEKESEEGLAHFFEHMVFKGTDKFKTAKVLAETLDSIGADFNAFTSKDYTGYYVRSASANFSLALDILSDMLFRPKLRQADIDSEKRVIIEELNMYADNPSSHVAEAFEKMIFKEEALAHPIIGRKETINSFKNSDFRSFIKRFYAPENLLLVIAGGLKDLAKNQVELLQQIEKALAKLEEERVGLKNPFPESVGLSPAQVGQETFSKDKFLLVKKDTEQAHFVMAWPAINTHHKDRYALQVLSTIVGGNMSSRLFSQVREERGLAYYVNSDIDLFHDSGLFGCSAGVDRNRAEEAIKVSKAVFTDLASKKAKIGSQELSRAKEYLRGKTLLSLENSNSVAQFFGIKKLLRNELLSVDDVLAKISEVTVADLSRLAAEIIRDGELRLAIIGNFKNEEKLRLAMS
jgi:predicted Zn-dependent peptidase